MFPFPEVDRTWKALTGFVHPEPQKLHAYTPKNPGPNLHPWKPTPLNPRPLVAYIPKPLNLNPLKPQTLNPLSSKPDPSPRNLSWTPATPQRRRQPLMAVAARQASGWIQALGFRVQGLGFRVWGLGFRVWGLGFRHEI